MTHLAIVKRHVKSHLGRTTTNSRAVAEIFGKAHKHVLRDIDDMISEVPECGPILSAHPLRRRCRTNGGTRSVPVYEMTRDGFTLLA